MKRVCVLVALLLAASLSACNTVKGAGQDIQKGGEKLENSADQHSS
ncbi:entericidin A/B family lipoprotein [Silvimonas amylolytica]|nr:entericidin A/B family lipoprotein [Silvimonas amylolytica]